MWLGGWCFGPRHLLVLSVLLIFESAIFFSKEDYNKTAFWICIGAGLTINLLDKCTIQHKIYSGVDQPIIFVFESFFKGEFNTYNLLSNSFNTPAGFVALIYPILFALGFLLLTKLGQKLISPIQVIEENHQGLTSDKSFRFWHLGILFLIVSVGAFFI